MVADDSYVPARGDLVWLEFSPQSVHEQKGRRPALVLSPRSFNERRCMALFCPIMSIVAGYPFEVLLPSDVEITGVVLSDQIMSLDCGVRHVRYAGVAPAHVVEEVVGKLSALL